LIATPIKSTSLVVSAGLACSFIAASCLGNASAGEVCRFTGTTDYDGKVDVTTTVAAAGDTTSVDVVVVFSAITMPWFPLHYLVEERSTWRGGALDDLAANTRYSIGAHIVRQQWDYFRGGPDGLRAYRVEGKTGEKFEREYPRFARHWDVAAFGLPWLRDYQSAAPKRRPDLDLAGDAVGAHLRTPFAMAFYWVRWLARGGTRPDVFLPGFKTDKLVRLSISPIASSYGTTWFAPLHYVALSETPPSSATAVISPDSHLARLAFELHGSAGSAHGLIRQLGCEGEPVVPAVQWR
jgi:hypothetical protein